MNRLPFDKLGPFYKGNLHTHSTLSDGHLSPQQVCETYQMAGYDFIALTDHFMQAYNFVIADTRPFRTSDFTTLIGAELHSGKTELGNLWHILGVGLPLDFAPPTPEETGPQLAARALAAGAYVAAAHPGWYSLTEQDILSLGSIDAIEVFNGTAVDHNDRADSWYITDLLLARGHRFTVCATDDAHFNPARADAMVGWVHVKSDALTPEALRDALKAGYYYSSTGPQIHDVQIHPSEKIVVRCSPVERIWVTGITHVAVAAHGNGLIEAELDIRRFDSPYGRIVLRDARGGRAWTNPFWFE
jgi:histidinol phosphatase-like PHP family hydrolase